MRRPPGWTRAIAHVIVSSLLSWGWPCRLASDGQRVCSARTPSSPCVSTPGSCSARQAGLRPLPSVGECQFADHVPPSWFIHHGGFLHTRGSEVLHSEAGRGSPRFSTHPALPARVGPQKDPSAVNGIDPSTLGSPECVRPRSVRPLEEYPRRQPCHVTVACFPLAVPSAAWRTTRRSIGQSCLAVSRARWCPTIETGPLQGVAPSTSP